MKTKIIPFNLETAKKIQTGEIEGKIKTRDSKDVDEIVVFRTPLEYKVYAVINGRPHSFTEIGFERSWDKSGKWRGDLVIEVPDNEPQFKPFDKVLVRRDANYDGDPDTWVISFFMDESIAGYRVLNGEWFDQCIPYEGNEYLAGTTDKPKKEEL